MKTKLILALAAVLAIGACSPKIESTVPAKVIDGMIVTEIPDREPGQESALQLVCEPIDTVRIGFVGMGGRGNSALRRYFHMDNIVIAALCDLEQDRVTKSNAMIQEAGFPAAKEYVGEDAYKQMCADPDIDLVYITTDWKPHTTIAVCAMENGKHAAIEVPAAMSLAECWALVNTAEKTRRHCMMLENCVYDFFESSCLNMAQQGLFGEIYYAAANNIKICVFDERMYMEVSNILGKNIKANLVLKYDFILRNLNTKDNNGTINNVR